MPRRPRLDYPGSWHHVVNRGIAKRPLFETRADIRYFQSRLAREVRRGQIEVHAFCFMTTHFHLLLRSPVGALSAAMRRAQNAYVRRFNRLHHRDGSLVRGRYLSRPIESDHYLQALVRYIDHNPVRAGLVLTPAEHEFGSARYYLVEPAPKWLRRDVVLAHARRIAGMSGTDAMAYRAAFDVGGPTAAGELHEWIEARIAARVAVPAADDDLLAAAGSRDRSWLEWRSRIADGRGPTLPVCAVSALRRAVAENVGTEGVWMVEDGRRTWRGAEIALHGLMHDLCGLSQRQIAQSADGSEDRVRLHCLTHRRLLRENDEYARRALEVGRQAVLASIQPRR